MATFNRQQTVCELNVHPEPLKFMSMSLAGNLVAIGNIDNNRISHTVVVVA